MMDISKKEGDFLKLTDSASDEVAYLRISEIIMVCKVEGPDYREYETVITLRNGKEFPVSSTAEKVMEYVGADE